MAHKKIHHDFDSSAPRANLAKDLGLENLGVSITVLARGEGYDYFHNHREQEELYICLEGTADLILAGDDPSSLEKEQLTLERGDIVRVDAGTLRAIGNLSSDRAVILIAGACPHPYPAGFGDHDAIADVLSVCGEGETGFTRPITLEQRAPTETDDDC